MKGKLAYFIAMGILIVALLFTIRECGKKVDEINAANQNVVALRDSTKKTVDALGRTEYERSVFAGNIETLKKLNKELMDEAAKQKGNTRVIGKVETKIRIDTIYLVNNVYQLNDSTFNIIFAHNKNYDTSNSISFNGITTSVIGANLNGKLWLTSKETIISNLALRMKLYTGLKQENGVYSIFARTDFPNVEFALDGAIIDPDKNFYSTESKKKFSVMLGTGIGYGVFNSQVKIVPSVGLYVGLNLFNF